MFRMLVTPNCRVKPIAPMATIAALTSPKPMDWTMMLADTISAGTALGHPRPLPPVLPIDECHRTLSFSAVTDSHTTVARRVPTAPTNVHPPPGLLSPGGGVLRPARLVDPACPVK